MNITDAIQKAAKLLRLAQSDNPNESAAAAAKAQEIIDRYKLTLDPAQLDEATGTIPNSQPDEPIQDFERDPLTTKGKLDRWQGMLAMGVAKVNQCKAYATRGNLALIGRASDVQACRYLFTWLSGEVDRLASKQCAGCGRTYWNNFRIGAVETITERLAAQQKATFDECRAEALQITDGAKQSHALALVTSNASLMIKRAATVEQWAETHKRLVKRSQTRTAYSHNAREAGRQAGRNVALSASHRLA